MHFWGFKRKATSYLLTGMIAIKCQNELLTGIDINTEKAKNRNCLEEDKVSSIIIIQWVLLLQFSTIFTHYISPEALYCKTYYGRKLFCFTG
jgi:hypothetical protein